VSCSKGRGTVRLGALTLLVFFPFGAVFAQNTGVVQEALIAADTAIVQGTPQDMRAMGWEGKLRFHAASAYGPGALAGAVVYDGFLQGIDFPREWGPGWLGYSKRFGSTLAYSGVRNLLGFGLDSMLHQDPRYYRSTERGTWHRAKHAFHETIFTHKDSGGQTLATWRLGSAYGAAFISNEWYPDRVNTVALGFSQGSTQLGFDLLSNLGSEFWPDIKRKWLRRKP